MKKYLTYAFALALLATACGEKAKTTDNNNQDTDKTAKQEDSNNFEGLREKAQKTFAALPEMAESETNPVTEEKVALGKKLFFDKRLSKDNTQSCNTCHNLANYGVDNEPTSPGNDGERGERNSPTVYNAALHMAQFWDGREPDVEAQAGGPILNPVEMAMHSEKDVVTRLVNDETYTKMFKAAFPDEAEPISYTNLTKAIGAFERKLLTPSRFDDYLKGDDNALTAEEKKGMQTFMAKGCVTCHSGQLLGGNLYQKFGLMGGDYWEHTGSHAVDSGRYAVTGKKADLFMFKVPSLRNVAKTQPYFHDGSVDDLEKAVMIMGELQVAQDVSPEEAKEIVTFLESLTGDLPKELIAMEAPANEPES